MSTEINITNGSGWNNYPALKGLILPRGTKGLLKSNAITRLDIEPADAERPFGIAARYYDSDRELIFTQHFDQNDTGSWIRAQVVELLTKTIRVRKEELAAERHERETREALAAGFPDRLTHARAKADAARVHRAADHAAQLAREAYRQTPAHAAAALATMASLIRQHPDCIGIGRKGALLVAGPVHPLPTPYQFTDHEGMLAWLTQHGFRQSVDDRHHFYAAAAESLAALA